MNSKQRGWIGQGISEAIVGMVIVVAVASFFFGGLLFWLAPNVWNWLKPIIHGWTA